MTEIIKALLNADTDKDFIPYLHYALQQMDIDTSQPLSIAVDSDQFSFLKQFYPNLTLTTVPNEKLLHFTTSSNNSSTLTFTFSFYKHLETKSDDVFKVISIDLKEGVVVNTVDRNLLSSDPYQFYPYALCLTDKPESFKTFLKIIGFEKIKGVLPKVIDVYCQEPILYIDYKSIKKIFKTIEIHHSNHLITTVCQTSDEWDNSRTLRIHAAKSTSPSMVEYSMKNILVDYEKVPHQSIIDTLSNFPEKILWASGKDSFFKDLEKYSLCGSLKKSLKCYQLKKKLPLLTHDKLDWIIKLGLISPSIQDAIQILDDKSSHYKKLYKLKDLDTN